MSSDSKRDMPLSAAGILSAQQVDVLEQHWVTTLEQFLALGANAQRTQRAASLLDVGVADFEDAIARAKDLAPEVAEEAVAYPYEDFMGCLEPPAEAPSVPPQAVAAAPRLPEKANLIPRMPPIRDQGRRGTCVAFACAAVREFLTGIADEDLSEQFLYWACKEHDGYPGVGTWLHVGIDRLLEDGICPEETWPYNPAPIDGNEGQGPPPPGAVTAAREYRLAEAFCLVRRPDPPMPVQPFKAYLGGEAPRPIAMAVPLFDSFFNQSTRRTGRVIMPLPGEDIRGGHAMCMVGYQDDASVPGGGFFLVRNSWGEGWGYACDVGAGHALIPYEYISAYCWEGYTGEAEPVSGGRLRPNTIRTPLLDYGHCGACGKRIVTVLDIVGRCGAPDCSAPICNHCWTARGTKRCRRHTSE